MGHPCFSDQPADHDDTVREADQRVNDPDLTLGADRQLLEPSVVPRISSFHHPAHSGLKGFALGADLPTATQLGKQLPRRKFSSQVRPTCAKQRSFLPLPSASLAR